MIPRFLARGRVYLSQKPLKTPKNGHFTLLNTCINWYAQELLFFGGFWNPVALIIAKNTKKLLKKSARKMLEKWGFLGGSKLLTPNGVLKLQFCMLKERLMNPGTATFGSDGNVKPKEL